MLKKVISAATIVILLQTGSFAVPIRNSSNTGDVFNGNSNEQTTARFGASPSICNDPQISQIEKSSGTTARVFEPAASGSKQGQFGRWLETNGYVYHTGVCAGTGYLVMFIYNSKIPSANKVANEVFSSNSSPQNKPPDISNLDIIAAHNEEDKKNFLEVCQIIFGQQGNFNGFPNCASCTIQAKYPECLASAPEEAYKPYELNVRRDGGGGFNPSNGSYHSQYDNPRPVTPTANRPVHRKVQDPLRQSLVNNGYRYLVGTAPWGGYFQLDLTLHKPDKNRTIKMPRGTVTSVTGDIIQDSDKTYYFLIRTIIPKQTLSNPKIKLQPSVRPAL